MTYTDSKSEYLDLGSLQTRIETHRLYSERPEDVEQAVLNSFSVQLDDALLDVGSGTGSFLARLRSLGHRGRLVGLDTSPAAIDELRKVQRVEAVLGDAAVLPFAESEFSVVTARHMLYHVPEPTVAIREAYRVLCPGGWFVAAVNFADSLPETGELLRSVVARHGIDVAAGFGRPSLHAQSLPALIEPTFGDVETIQYSNALVYPTADALARYAVAMLSFYGVGPDFANRGSVVEDVVTEAGRRFDMREGPLRDPKGFSVFVARH